jgi:predicted nucleotidyltransferase
MELSPQVINKSEIEKSRVTDEWNMDFLKRHKLTGHAYLRTQNKVYYPYWKSQHNRNSIAKQELETIGEDLKKENIQVYLLKGFSLMGEIYKDWGERFVSDIDLLVSYDQLWRLTDILKMYGYEKKKIARWLGNRHKHIFVKTVDDIRLTIEIHTQLFWHTSLKTDEDLGKSKVEGFHQLSRENQLIHLCGHVAFQHAYSKLYWLMDIFKYVERNKDKMDWESFWQKAEQANLYKSCFFTLFLCQKLGLNIQTILYRAQKKKKISIYLLKKMVNFSFLYNPDRFRVRLVAVKFLIKDSIFDNFRYFYEWLKTFKLQAKKE